MEESIDDQRLTDEWKRLEFPQIAYMPDSKPNSVLASRGGLDTYLRYYHTLRHLRPVQIYGRAWHRLAPSPPPVEGAALPLRDAAGPWRVWVERESTMLGPKSFRFLSRSLEVDAAQGGWTPNAAPEKLWLLNLHYFDDLNAIDADRRRDWHFELISDWITANPPAESIGWRDAYALSLRIVNWIKWHRGGGCLTGRAQRSLVTQV